jgi:hypothetical protein
MGFSCYTSTIAPSLYIYIYIYIYIYTGCPTRYRTRYLFNNFTTNEDIATKSEADLPHCVRNVKEKNVLLFKFRYNIFIGVRIIKEMPGSVASGTLCIHRHTYTHISSGSFDMAFVKIMKY